MRHFTSTHAQFLIKLFSQSILIVGFQFLIPVLSIAQVGSISGNPAPLAAPQQFTTNLVSVNVGGNQTVDGNIAILNNSFSNVVDQADGVKVNYAEKENFNLKRDGIELLLESRMQVVVTDTLFYSMSNLKVQDYQLQFFPININLPGLIAILVDRYLNVKTPLNLNIAPFTYAFNVSADAASFANDRFIMVFIQSSFAPLPVNFLSIAANKVSNSIVVNWKVASERSILHYSIEKSLNGKTFNAKGLVAAAGFNEAIKSYSFTDNDITNTTVFYRIKSIGIDGAFKYSAIVKVLNGNIKAGINVSPNPVEGNLVNLQLIKTTKGRYIINLIGTDGKAVFSNYIQHAGDNATFPLSLPSTLAKGTYILQVIAPDKTRQSQILVIGAGK